MINSETIPMILSLRPGGSGYRVIISERARQKLLAHARQVLFYNGLAKEEKAYMMDMLRKKMLSDRLHHSEIEETLETVEKFLNVDPVGGARKVASF